MWPDIYFKFMENNGKIEYNLYVNTFSYTNEKH